MSTLVPIFAILMVTCLVLRIYVFRPHWLGNLITMIVLVLYTLFMSAGTLPGEGIAGDIVGCALITFVLHLLAKKRDKKKQKKQAQKIAAAQVPQYPIHTPVYNPVQAPQVAQTLTSCMRCHQPLQGAKCKTCGFDHTAQPILLLTPVDPAKLQLRIPKK